MAKHQHNFSCPIGDTLGIIAGRWKPEILWHLKDVELDLVELAKGYGVNNIKLGDKIEKGE